jgi:phage-related protein
MTRQTRAANERPLFWVGSARRDLLGFPEDVRSEIGVALSVAQFGGKHPKAKSWKGVGPGVFEIVDDHRGNAYRAVYTVRFENAVYLLHAFQKKSPRAIKTPKTEVDLVTRRLRAAQTHYEGWHGK